ncbi:MAG: AI-2E family transporter [Pseudomonadota bacterium]|nr:AI-2E family transporter [Pseudomonadota bacterium]
MSASSERGGERRTTLVAFLLLLVAVATPVFLMVRPYALTLLLAGIVAVITDPIYRRLRRRGMRPYVAGGVVSLGIFLLVVTPTGLFTWAALQEAAALPSSLSQAGVFDIDALLARLHAWPPARRLLADPAATEAQLRDTIASAAATVTNLVLAALSQVPALLLHAGLALLGCFFFLVDGRRLLLWLSGKVPLPPQIVDVLFLSFRESAGAVVLASMAAASAQAAVTLVGFLALGVPAAFVAAGLAFIFAWVPLLGVAPVYATGMLYLWFARGPWDTLFLLLVGLGAGVIDNVIRPAVLRGRQQMHPMVSLVAIFGGIAVFGIFGAFVGPILAAVFIALLETWPTVAAYAGIEVSDTGSPPTIDLPVAEMPPTAPPSPPPS